jgi:cytochrome P450
VFLTLLGLPLDELPTFLKMKDGIIRPEQVVGTAFGSEEAVAYQKQIADSIYEYFDAVLDVREAKREDDILSMFLDAEVDGDRLTRHDILDICFLFLIAGLDTVTATLDCMYGYLCQHPDQQQLVRDDPSIIPNVVEELLRWETPVTGVARIATQDTEIGGCPVKGGTMVMALLGSGNTDEADLADADQVRFDRDVNRHLAFGGGIHRCLGSHLARRELRLVVEEWLAAIPDFTLAEGADPQIVWPPGTMHLKDLPLVFPSS